MDIEIRGGKTVRPAIGQVKSNDESELKVGQKFKRSSFKYNVEAGSTEFGNRLIGFTGRGANDNIYEG